jgi:tRNA pseudouridine38-40 synthase
VSADSAPPTPPDHAIGLVLAYDGEDFAGFVRQPGQRTAQGELEKAIEIMNGVPALTRPAARTDSGVHAVGQRVAFDPARDIDDAGWIRGLNAKLPPDVAVLEVSRHARGYNPRFDSIGKTYRYLLQVRDQRDPLWRRRAWWLPKSRQRDEGGLDLDQMRDAATRLTGTHDFRIFRAADDDREQTVRTMFSIDLVEGWAGEPSLLAIEVSGNAFMKNMVRILVGTLVDVGRGKLAPGAIDALFAAGAQRSDAGMTAPAHGLTLVQVRVGRQAPTPA